MRTGCLRVSSVSALHKPSTRSVESIVESREVHIKRWLDSGVVKDKNNEDAIKTGANILSVRCVDDAHKEKSRWCARELAMYKDPSVSAAASDVDNTSLVDLLAVKSHWPTYAVAKPDRERRQMERSDCVARSICGHIAVEGVSGNFQAESEASNISVGSSFDQVGALMFIDEEGIWVREPDKYNCPCCR